MTGRGHRLTGIGAAFLGAAFARFYGMPELLVGGIAALSTTLPDQMEVPFFKNGVRTGSLIAHRTLTHWPVLWLCVLVWGVNDGGLIGAGAIGMTIGALVHILGDAPTPMGIPWLLPHRRLKVGKRGWWKSGEHEFLIPCAFAAAGYATWYLSGGRMTFLQA